jgi:hypothetical protein
MAKALINSLSFTMPVPAVTENFNASFAPTLYLLALEENRDLSSGLNKYFSGNNFLEINFRKNENILCFYLTRFANSQEFQHVYFTRRQGDKATRRQK